MCYSAMVEADLHKLSLEFSADIDELRWQKLGKKRKSIPKAFKLPDENQRIFPKYFAPIVTGHGGKLIVTPMIYSAHPPSYMSSSQGSRLTTYNARRDSLEKRFWSESISQHHGLLIVKGFYEWVERFRI